MKAFFYVSILLVSCTFYPDNQQSQIIQPKSSTINTNKESLKILKFYQENNTNEGASINKGTVSNGSLVNGSIIPFYGPNFRYFDEESYLSNRAFTSDFIKSIILKTYEKLNNFYPDRKFFLMELSNKNGGKIYPHRTHQNGLSVDFMLPKTKMGFPNYQLDTLGKNHYFLNFNDKGEYKEDTTIKIDFDLVAKHILLIDQTARELGYKIKKVIIKIEYKKTLFSTFNGSTLKKSKIYFAEKLSPLINSLHDDHFHIDFEKE